MNALSSESLDEKFPKLARDAQNSSNASVLIFEANTLKKKSEKQVLKMNKLEDTLNIFWKNDWSYLDSETSHHDNARDAIVVFYY